MDKVQPATRSEIVAALETLSRVTQTEALEGKTRDEIGHVRSVLWDIVDNHADLPEGDRA
jgi:hypothetical protein